uniref:Uncharacterized protein n=1 Tax=Cacopsylla melanoneura TaxID=428564 RepID=A0A8D9FED4_9HEMI
MCHSICKNHHLFSNHNPSPSRNLCSIQCPSPQWSASHLSPLLKSPKLLPNQNSLSPPYQLLCQNQTSSWKKPSSPSLSQISLFNHRSSQSLNQSSLSKILQLLSTNQSSRQFLCQPLLPNQSSLLLPYQPQS